MALIIKEIRLEVSKPNLIQAIVAKQNDCNSRFLKVSLWDEGTQIPIRSTAEVTINAERKDGASDSFFGEVNEDNTVTVPLHSWMLELAGDVNCDVSIIVEGRKLTTTSFVVMVEKAANNDEASNDPQQNVLAELISKSNMVSQGRSAKYNFTSGGWKRILNIIRGSNGTINLGCGTGEWLKYHRSLAFDVCGFVKFPEDTNPNSSPLLMKRFENVCGDDDAMANPPAKITKVRVGYPKKGTTFTPINGGTHNYASAPVNCYVDIFVEFDASNLVNKYATFSMNYAGFADSHNCDSILEETDATDTGIYGEELTYYTVTTEDMPYYLNSNTGFNSAANALKGSAEGNPITIDDISPFEHEILAGVYKKWHTIHEVVTDSNWSFGHSFSEDAYYGVYLTVTGFDKNKDVMYFDDGSWWESSGQLTASDKGTPLADAFKVGEVVYVLDDPKEALITISRVTVDIELLANTPLRTFGKNLLNMDAFPYFDAPVNGVYTSNRNVGTDAQVLNLPTDNYILTAFIKAPAEYYYRLRVWHSDGSQSRLTAGQATATKDADGFYKQTLQITGKDIKSIGFFYSGNGTGKDGEVQIKEIQLELGETATKYEPFVTGATYTADENGNVKATSIYPTTLLVAESGATITAEYNADTKKYIDKKFNELAAMIAGS